MITSYEHLRDEHTSVCTLETDVRIDLQTTVTFEPGGFIHQILIRTSRDKRDGDCLIGVQAFNEDGNLITIIMANVDGGEASVNWSGCGSKSLEFTELYVDMMKIAASTAEFYAHIAPANLVI